MRRKRAIYGICRVDHADSSTHGWVVTIQRRGVVHRKHFSDGLHGGKRATLAAAKRYRDELVARFPPLLKREYAEIPKPNNQSGVAGVCRVCVTETRSRAPSVQRWFWVASWTLPDGRRRHRKFSIRLHGEEPAFRMAVKARREALAELTGVFDPGSTRVARGVSQLG